MTPYIRFVEEWSDEHVVELRVEVCDGTSSFVNRVYAGHDQLRHAVAGLHGFQGQTDGDTFDLRFGEFGPDCASGAFDARLQYRRRGKILVRVRMQSEFDTFDDEKLASEATFHLVSEAVLLDEFVRGLRSLSNGTSADAALEAIGWN
jgi:hypothetical protein